MERDEERVVTAEATKGDVDAADEGAEEHRRGRKRAADEDDDDAAPPGAAAMRPSPKQSEGDRRSRRKSWLATAMSRVAEVQREATRSR